MVNPESASLMIPPFHILFLIVCLSRQSSLDTAGLSSAIKQGDQNAFRRFHDEHYPGLYRFLCSRGLNHDEAQDLIQKAFLMIWEKREQIDETKSLRAYLFQIAYSRMINYVNYQSRFSKGELPEESSVEPTPEEELDYQELLTFVRQILLDMPERRSAVFELCFMKQFTYKEAAGALDISVKTVENHMGFAFKELRKELKQRYGKTLTEIR